tara:strand:- start:244 stop:456 length:213 start_codon:yes stop_codon:yes gene_type:complete
MCFFNPPKPPKLPEPKAAPTAIEKTATDVVVAKKRKSEKPRPGTARMRSGTRSLRIPLSRSGTRGGNLSL